MGTSHEWFEALFLAVFWGAGMLLFLRPIKQARWVGCIMLAIAGVDVGILSAFFSRAFHSGLVLILVAVNAGLIPAIFALRRISRELVK
jgi:hypothetical protein